MIKYKTVRNTHTKCYVHMHYALHINNKIMIIMMRIYQWTFQKEALLVYCFQVELQFGVLLFVKVGRQENCNLYTSFLCHMQFSKEWLLSFEFVHVVINEDTSTECMQSYFIIIFLHKFEIKKWQYQNIIKDKWIQNSNNWFSVINLFQQFTDLPVILACMACVKRPGTGRQSQK